MGCAGDREKIEDKIMLMKLKRMEIQMEKEKHIKKLSDIDGHSVKWGEIPDYIDPEFAKKNNIYDENNDYLKTDANGQLNKKLKNEQSDKKGKKDKKKEKPKKEKEKNKKEKKNKDKTDKKEKDKKGKKDKRK